MRSVLCFSLLVPVLAGCGAGSGAHRDALWRRARAPAAVDDGATLFAGDATLDRAALVEAVLARNPDVASARAGLRAALAEIPAAEAWDDPMIAYAIAPLSVAADVPLGQRVELRQKLPFPGKRRLAGEVALAEADAAAAEIEVVRLELAELASALYDDHFVVARALEINEHHRMLMTEIQKSAEVQYVAGRAAQQDPLQAEVALARLERDRLTLESERGQIVARLNSLLHRAPDAPVPPPPPDLELAPAPPGTSEELQAIALERLPRREALRARLDAGRAAIAAARRDYYPDLEVMAAYDAMMMMPEHRWMVGVMVEIPLQRGRRRAAVERAEAMTEKLRHEDERLVDEIRAEVDRAHRRVVEARAIVAVHEERLVPAATDQLAAARAGFVAAQNGFTEVLDAEESLREAGLTLELARAELSRRQAALARAVGAVPGLPVGGEP